MSMFEFSAVAWAGKLAMLDDNGEPRPQTIRVCVAKQLRKDVPHDGMPFELLHFCETLQTTDKVVTIVERAHLDSMGALRWDMIAVWMAPADPSQALIESLIRCAGVVPDWDDRHAEIKIIHAAVSIHEAFLKRQLEEDEARKLEMQKKMQEPNPEVVEAMRSPEAFGVKTSGGC